MAADLGTYCGSTWSLLRVDTNENCVLRAYREIKVPAGRGSGKAVTHAESESSADTPRLAASPSAAASAAVRRSVISSAMTAGAGSNDGSSIESSTTSAQMSRLKPGAQEGVEGSPSEAS